MRFERLVPAVAGLLILAGALIASCGPQPAAPSAADPEAPAPVTVQVTKPERHNLAATLTYNGEVRARDQVNVTSKIAGRIQELNVDVGASVKAGDPIAVLDHTDLENQVAQAQAGVAAAQARLNALLHGPRAEQVAQAEANLRSAQAALDQLQAGPTPDQIAAAEAQVRLAKNQLYLAQSQADAALGSRLPTTFTPDQKEAAAGVAYEQIRIAEAQLAQLKAGPTAAQLAQAQAAVDAAQQQLALAKAPYTADDVNQARAAVAQAEAGLQLAKSQLNEAWIYAPIDGIVADRLMAPGALASPGSAIVSIISDKVEVTVSVEETQLGKLQTGMSASLSVPAYPSETIPGTIRLIAPTGDQQSRTFTVKIDPQDNGMLRPGMFTSVAIVLDERSDALTVPKSAVSQASDQSYVFVIKDGKASRQDIQIGVSSGELVEVTGGLGPEDQVILTGAATLDDGDPVVVAGS